VPCECQRGESALFARSLTSASRLCPRKVPTGQSAAPVSSRRNCRRMKLRKARGSLAAVSIQAIVKRSCVIHHHICLRCLSIGRG